ncbi:ABC transporter substrate-binding protein [Mesorhizobium koreense]|uniref:ABC transporter substrate-binding protein n=1 Tax=Mesorhizobium koreense TaxID=3074855 RepID=UPI00287BA0C7|nr:ABC transporter substrate-binding protein [Mesorhizobium sp. WR6]
MGRTIRSTRRTFLKTSAVVAGALAVPNSLFGTAARAAGTRSVTVQLGWLINAYHTGDIVAKEMGYLEEEGLDVAFHQGGPSIDGIASVASGQAQIGQISSSPSIMYAVSQSIPIKAFAVGAQRHPFAYFSRPEAPVKQPKDLIGKKLGLPQLSKIINSAVLKRNNIDESQVEIVTIGADKTPFMTRQVDVITSWTTDLGPLAEVKDLVVMHIWDHGVPLYALPYYATHDTVDRNQPLLDGYLRAAARGWEFTKTNPEKAAEIAIRAYPNLNREKTLAGVKIFLGYCFNSQTRQNGWGTFETGIWADQVALFDGLNQFPSGAPKLDNLITTAVLNATEAARPKLG